MQILYTLKVHTLTKQGCMCCVLVVCHLVTEEWLVYHRHVHSVVQGVTTTKLYLCDAGYSIIKFMQAGGVNVPHCRRHIMDLDGRRGSDLCTCTHAL